MRPPSVFLIISFSSAKRVVGSPLNFQSAVNTCAVLLIALVILKKSKKKLVFLKKNTKSEFIENRTKTRGYYFRVPCITLSMFYWHDTNKKIWLSWRWLRRIKPNKKRYLYYARNPMVPIMCTRLVSASINSVRYTSGVVSAAQSNLEGGPSSVCSRLEG